uniref:Glycosyltransferase n=1 Tax=candidate division CPR3 bacterium TaxID=2268181 RepID=A0A7V3N525_UNCC3
MPKVSVFLITYNRVNLVGEAIEAILNQTYGDFELIIMDNGSTDGTSEFVNSKFKDRRIRMHRNEINSRTYVNLTFEIASGDYMLITHDDDMMAPNMLEREVKILDKYPDVVLVASNITIIDLNHRIVWKKGVKIEEDKVFERGEFIESFLKKGIYLPMPTALMRRKFFIENNLRFNPDVGPASDTYLWFEVNLFPKKLYLISDSLYFYTSHGEQDSVSNSFSIELTFFKGVIDFLRKEGYVNLIPLAEKRFAKSLASSSSKSFFNGKIDWDTYNRAKQLVVSIYNQNEWSLLERFIFQFKLRFPKLFFTVKQVRAIGHMLWNCVFHRRSQLPSKKLTKIPYRRI